ncbi:methyltransferase domain-containing protein [Leptospira ognonensis]|uniref:Methyltransferase domain-containing protein n=1 Tax=Leptospira ognonensis TaxID=2484945 RepID=A0A4R9KA76_9LEPT|nr:methyltransferase domain-containing protein [Leptospira ognonensis]TGL62714.1 methyltransferase domain-containing protein [Leptospira ognonensis]
MSLFSKKKEESFNSLSIDTLTYKIQKKIQITDADFDSLYPEKIQQLSAVQWTPVDVILQIHRHMKFTKQDRILDIGSGVGKFCLVSSLLSDALFFGIERRKHLFEIAESVQKDLKTKNVKFKLGEMISLDWSNYNVLYFYNPFYESLTAKNEIDDQMEKGLQKFTLDLIRVKNRLSLLPRGTKVITYHSFGGKMPNSFQQTKKISLVTGDIEFYEKIE